MRLTNFQIAMNNGTTPCDATSCTGSTVTCAVSSLPSGDLSRSDENESKKIRPLSTQEHNTYDLLHDEHNKELMIGQISDIQVLGNAYLLRDWYKT